MPTYSSRLTTVQLAVADLQDTTTTNPKTRARVGVYDEITECADKMAKASIHGTLDEIPVSTEANNSTPILFLGKFRNMPFFLVRAGKAFFEPNAEGRRTRRPARVPQDATLPQPSVLQYGSQASSPNEPQGYDERREDEYERISRQSRPPIAPPPQAIPQALFLSVFLSRASFLPTHFQDLHKTIYHDVKIDVYFNGELCASTHVSKRYHGKPNEQIFRFSGRRVDRVLERPWVLLPPGQGPDGFPRPRQPSIAMSGGAQNQWTSVSKALLEEASKLPRGPHGELSFLGDYLSSLASLETPKEVHDMQEVGGANIGVIDVVVTAGRGHKDDANALCLTKPTPIRLELSKDSGTKAVNGKRRRGSRISRGDIFTNERSISDPVNIAQARPKTIGLCPSSIPSDRIKNPARSRRPATSRADAEILLQGFLHSEPRAVRSRAGNIVFPGSSVPFNPTINPDIPVLVIPSATGIDTTAPSHQPYTPLDPHLERFHTPQMTFSPAFEPAPAYSLPAAQESPSTAVTPSARPRRRKLGYVYERVVDRKPTLEEEIGKIEKEAAEAAQVAKETQATQATLKSVYGAEAHLLPRVKDEDVGYLTKYIDRRLRLRDARDGEKQEVKEEVKDVPGRITTTASHKNSNSDNNQSTKPKPKPKSKIIILKIRAPQPPPQPLKSLSLPPLPPPPSSPPPHLPTAFSSTVHLHRPYSSSPLRQQPSNRRVTLRSSDLNKLDNPIQLTPDPPAIPRRHHSRPLVHRLVSDSAPGLGLGPSPGPGPGPALSHSHPPTPTITLTQYLDPDPNPDLTPTPSLSHLAPPSLVTNTNVGLSARLSPSPLSEDSIASYAPPHVLRQVKAERNGWFREVAVVMGARFLVG